MKLKDQKKLTHHFDTRFLSAFPEYDVSATGKDAGGGVLYADQDKILRAFVYVQPHDSNDTFTVEPAANRSGKFPWKDIPNEFAWDDTNEHPKVYASPPRDSFRFRLPALWPPHIDFWWPISSVDEPDLDDNDAWERLIFSDEADEASIDRLESSIQDAIGRIEEYGIPYIQAVRSAIRKHG